MPANEAHEQPVLTILITSEPANRFTLFIIEFAVAKVGFEPTKS